MIARALSMRHASLGERGARMLVRHPVPQWTTDVCVHTHAPELRPVLLTLLLSFPLLLPDPTGRRWWRERTGSLSLSVSHTHARTHGSLSAWALLLHPPCPSPQGPRPAFVCASGWQPPCIFNANLLSVLTNRPAWGGEEGVCGFDKDEKSNKHDELFCSPPEPKGSPLREGVYTHRGEIDKIEIWGMVWCVYTEQNMNVFLR